MSKSKPVIHWKKLQASTRLFMLHDMHGDSVRVVAKRINLEKSALQRILSGKPVSAANYAHICMWLDCCADKYLSTAR